MKPELKEIANNYKIVVKQIVINDEIIAIYELYIDSDFCCYQYKGFDIYNENESWYIWDSRDLNEYHDLKDFYDCIEFIDLSLYAVE